MKRELKLHYIACTIAIVGGVLVLTLLGVYFTKFAGVLTTEAHCNNTPLECYQADNINSGRIYAK